MARSASGSRSSAPAARARSAPASAVRQSSAPVAATPSGGGMLSTFCENMAKGFGVGTGHEVAHQAVGAVSSAIFGGSKEAAPVTLAAPPAYSEPTGLCMIDLTSLINCLKSSNAIECNYYYTALQNCQSSRQ